MTRLALCAAALAAFGCTNTTLRPPPTQQLYFPGGVAHVDVPGSQAGVLYVANGNFDKRYANGTFVALDLSKTSRSADGVGLPAFGSPVGASGPAQLDQLGLTFDGGMDVVKIAPFAGELGTWTKPDGGGLRFFVPARSEGDYLHVIDAPPPVAGRMPELGCFTHTPEEPRDCSSAAFSLSAYQDPGSNLPRATAPYGVAVAPDGEVFVSHLSNADSPKGSNKNLSAYVVRLRAELPWVDSGSFVNLGAGAVNTLAVGRRWVYLTGRALTGGTQLVRLMGRDGALVGAGLESQLGIIDARGASLSSDETRLYFAGRGPDRLVVVSIAGADSDAPVLRVMRTVPLPSAPNQLVTIPRPGRSDLVAITCSSAGVLALYDDDLGALTAQVPGVGLQPFGIAPDFSGAGVRLYVSNFGDGRVAVIDVPDLGRPYVARIVAHLGKDQLCLTRSEREGRCTEPAP